MIKDGIELYWNEEHTKYAILVSDGLIGWTVMNIPEVAYDKRIVEYVVNHMNNDWWKEGCAIESPMSLFWKSELYYRFDEFLNSIGYNDIYLPAIKKVKVVWIDAGRKWRVRDGGECSDCLEFEDEIEWNCGLDEAMKNKDYISSVKKTISESLSDIGNTKRHVCTRGKSSCNGCEFLMPGGTCTGVVYPTCPPQFDKCEFLR